MTGLPINALASSHMEDSIQAAEVPQPSNIKIRFKKGAIFAKLGDESAAVDIMVSQLPIRLSPESEKKRKAAQGTGFENDEHHVKRIKTEEKGKAVESLTIDITHQINKKATSLTSSTATTTISTSSKKASAPPAQIFRKLARKLSTQPALLDHLKEYRTSITSQHREDVKTIASLRVQLSTMTKEATEKELRAAEELKASQDMVDFWTDSCNDEYEATTLLKEKIRGLIGKVETMAKTEVVGDVSAGFGKGMQIEFELQKLGAELGNLIEEKDTERRDWSLKF